MRRTIVIVAGGVTLGAFTASTVGEGAIDFVAKATCDEYPGAPVCYFEDHPVPLHTHQEEPNDPSPSPTFAVVGGSNVANVAIAPSTMGFSAGSADITITTLAGPLRRDRG